MKLFWRRNLVTNLVRCARKMYAFDMSGKQWIIFETFQRL